MHSQGKRVFRKWIDALSSSYTEKRNCSCCCIKMIGPPIATHFFFVSSRMNSSAGLQYKCAIAVVYAMIRHSKCCKNSSCVHALAGPFQYWRIMRVHLIISIFSFHPKELPPASSVHVDVRLIRDV